MRTLRVAPWNSSVNGRVPAPKKDARLWFNGWKNLGLSDRRVYKDGKAAVFGEYLHVPVLGKDADGRVYRVYCKFKTGGKYDGETIGSVYVEKRGKEWFWILRNVTK